MLKGRPGLQFSMHALCRDAQDLGLKALRTWAFSDGSGQWNAIQPQLGQLNETILSQVMQRRSAPCHWPKKEESRKNACLLQGKECLAMTVI